MDRPDYGVSHSAREVSPSNPSNTSQIGKYVTKIAFLGSKGLPRSIRIAAGLFVVIWAIVMIATILGG